MLLLQYFGCTSWRFPEIFWSFSNRRPFNRYPAPLTTLLQDHRQTVQCNSCKIISLFSFLSFLERNSCRLSTKYTIFLLFPVYFLLFSFHLFFPLLLKSKFPQSLLFPLSSLEGRSLLHTRSLQSGTQRKRAPRPPPFRALKTHAGWHTTEAFVFPAKRQI